jgi:proteasome lid subunit RPN8/RPN11
MEYCSTVYVAGDRSSLSWRVTEPAQGDHNSCKPFFSIKDDDYPASQVWVVGYIHNHPCGSLPSSKDIGLWPTDAFDPYVVMAEVRLIPGNPAHAAYKNMVIEMASALVAERQDGTRVFLRYFPTGEVQQWSQVRSNWVALGRCAPRRANTFTTAPQCDEPLRVLHE